jgi:hypothetical protein
MNAEQAQPSPRRTLACVGIGAAIGPVIAFAVTALFFPRTPYARTPYARTPYARTPYARTPYARTPYEGALRWMLGAVPFGALVGWVISRLKRRR